jgi:hypothetical protein
MILKIERRNAMSKISDMMINAILKRGMISEGKNVKFDMTVPQDGRPDIKIVITVDSFTVEVSEEK